MNPLTVAILVVSDTASQDPSTDKSGSQLNDVFDRDGGDQWVVEEQQIVPDDVTAIQSQLTRWCDNEIHVNLVVTTGGTGFTGKDNTPEAVAPLIHKHATGLVHGMLAASLQITPFAVMSRPVAGVRNKTIIVTLPGSPKGAKENLQSILKQLPHACRQAEGEDSRIAHMGGVRALEKEAGIDATELASGHQHHHHGGHTVPKPRPNPADWPKSNDPKQGPSENYRESPYPKISIDEALEMVLANTPAPTKTKAAMDGGLVGHVLAEDVQADEPVPAFRASIVDGYAIIIQKGVQSSKGTFPVATVSHANPGSTPALQLGQVARITTGAPIPTNATSVVMRENTRCTKKSADDKEELEIEIGTNLIEPGEHVREIGSDVKAGDTILRKGEEVTTTGGELGLLASQGRKEILVYKKPLVGVLSTGNEIVSHDRPGALQLSEVRDTNRPALMAAVRGWGFETVDLGIADDSQGSLEQTIRDAMRQVDVIITTGGVSMGELDLLKPTIERSLGGTIHFGRVLMKPGLPTTFSTVPYKHTTGSTKICPIFSLPGNPASAIVTAHLFVLPCLQQACGISSVGLPKIWVTLDHEFGLSKARPEYHRAVARMGGDGKVYASSTGGQRSSRVGSFKGANVLVYLPARDGVLEKGERAEALLMGKLVGVEYIVDGNVISRIKIYVSDSAMAK